MILIKSCEPTQPTDVNSRFTHALLEFIGKQEEKKGQFELPEMIQNFNHKNAEYTAKACGSIILIPQLQNK